MLERFRNPFVDHQLASLTLNGTAKIQVRLLPILQSYTARFDQLPALLVCALAGQLWLYRGTSAEVLGDHPATVAAVQNVWAEERQVGLARTVERLLALTSLWKWDLNEVPGLAAELTHLLQMLRNHGAVHTVTRVLDRCGVRVAIRTEGTNHAE
ncbi:hypothetical protein GCM10025857_30080 [Alicyclobacillus contaminans]|nr:hypothetical protein GCM10025857_30080 [Alicyclobacillus contaminans]